MDMELMPVITHWGLFTGPQFTLMYVPRAAKQTPPEDEEGHRAAAARQEAQYQLWLASRGNFTSGGFSSSPSLCNCTCGRNQP